MITFTFLEPPNQPPPPAPKSLNRLHLPNIFLCANERALFASLAILSRVV